MLVPLCVNVWGQQPFELPKVVLLRTLVWLLAGSAIAGHLLGRNTLRLPSFQSPSRQATGLLALVIAVVSVTAVNRSLSLWGSYERQQGAVTLLTYCLLFVLATDHFYSLPRAQRLLTAVAAGGIPLVLLGLAQAAGWHPFALVSNARSSIYGSLGRANFLGAYLALLAPLTLALLLSAPNRGSRLLWAVLLAGELIVIILTLARAAWLATAVALLLFGFLWRVQRLTRWQRSLGWSGLWLLLLAGPLLVLGAGAYQPGSAASRLLIWRNSWALISARPLLGYGADAMGIIFPPLYPPELVYSQGREFYIDRAHNFLLDWALVGGLPGLLTYLLVVVTAMMTVGRVLHERQPRNKRLLLIAILAAVAGNTTNNLVSFDVTATALASWLLLGIGVALAEPPAPRASPRLATQRWGRRALAGLLSLLVATAVWQMNLRPLLADVAARRAHHHALEGDWAGYVAAAERAVRYWPSEPAHHLRLSQAYWEQARARPATASIALQQADRALHRARQLRPEDPILWLYSAQHYAAIARLTDANTFALAEDAYRHALARAPNNATIYAAWGSMYLDNSQPEAAAPLLQRAVALDATHGQAYIYLAEAELALGHLDEARAAYWEAWRWRPDSSRAATSLDRGAR